MKNAKKLALFVSENCNLTLYIYIYISYCNKPKATEY